MKSLLSILALCGLCHAADLDIEAVGRDLNGWNGDVARFAESGATFEVGRPGLATDAGGNLVATTVIRERKGRGIVFEGTVRTVISPDGLVRTLSMQGRVDGRPFETAEVGRPEPVAADAEGAAPVAEAAPVDPEEEMRDSFARSLRSAIERARSSEKVVKRDLSAWIFPQEASSADVLAEGVDVLVRAIFRRSAR